jgi:hypothetical protein
MRVTLYTDYFFASENAEVTIQYQSMIFPQFYIVSRIIKGSTVELVCRCQMQKLDRPFPLNDLVFDENGEMDTVFAIQRISEQIECGAAFPLAQDIPKLSESFLKNNNCLLILEKLSEALAGFWRIWRGTLTFVPFEEVFMDLVYVTDHGKINTGVQKSISRVVMSGGGETFDMGGGSFSQTVCIETEFASLELAASVYNRLSGFTYYPVMKTMCRAESYPPATSQVTFRNSGNINGDSFRINSIKAYPRRSGLYLEMANNTVREDEWDYSGKVGREIKRLNQLFSALEEGGDSGGSSTPWESDPDWEDFKNMPRLANNNRNIDIMVKVISSSRDVVLTIHSMYPRTVFSVDWGDGSDDTDITIDNTPLSGSNEFYNYLGRLILTHTYPRNGVYYVRIYGGCACNAMLAPKAGALNNPPLVIGWKFNYGYMNLLLNGYVKHMRYTASDYPMPQGDQEFFFRTKFLQLDGQTDMDKALNKKFAILYNPFMIEWVKANYTGIESEDDLKV